MKRHSKSNAISLAVATFLALASLSSSSAYAITVTGPKTANTGNNSVTIGAWYFFGNYYLAKCEDGAFAWLTTSTGASVNLGTSPNLNDFVIFNIFQDGNDTVTKVPSGGMWCAGSFMVPLQSNGYAMLMYLLGGNDTCTLFNQGGPMSVVAGTGNDNVLVEVASGNGYGVWGENGADQIGTYMSGNDVLYGGNDNDFLTWAGGGSNTCDGGSGSDKCSNSTCTSKTSCEAGAP